MDLLGAEDRARTGHPDLGKVVLYQMSYFRMKKNLKNSRLPTPDYFSGCKDNNPKFPAKFLSFVLFILRRVQSIAWHLYIGLSFVPMLKQAVTTANYEGQKQKYRQVKKKY